MDPHTTKLRRMYRAQKARRVTQENLWDEIEYYTGAPRAEEGSYGGMTSGGSGTQRRKDLWDFTAIDGREKLAASIQGAVSGPNLRWFKLSFNDSSLNNDIESRSWLDTESDNIWNDLQDSDFNTEIGCTYNDLVGPGHTFLAVEPVVEGYNSRTYREEWGGVDFTAIPLSQGFFTSDRKGDIREFWRRLPWTPAQVADFCESKGISTPEDISEKIEKGSEEQEEFVFCVFPRVKILEKARKNGVSYPAAPEHRPWGYVYWRESNGEVLCTGGYYEKPIYMCRWSKVSGVQWGYGPSTVALPTVKYVNAWREQIRLTGEKALDPPYLTEERNLLSAVDLNAGGLTVVRNIDRIKELQNSSRFDVADKILFEDREEIRRLYKVDELQLKDSPAMTATEAQIRYELMNRVLGKTLTFIQNDLLSPIVLTIMSMRLRLGAAQPIPRKVKRAGGMVAIEFQGPLARSQRTDEVAAIERGATFVFGLAQYDPRVRAAFDSVQAVKHVLDRLGVPANITPSESDQRKEIKRIEEQMARADNAESAKKEASAMKDAAAAAQAASPVAGATYPGLPPSPPLAPSGRVA